MEHVATVQPLVGPRLRHLLPGRDMHTADLGQTKDTPRRAPSYWFRWTTAYYSRSTQQSTRQPQSHLQMMHTLSQRRRSSGVASGKRSSRAVTCHRHTQGQPCLPRTLWYCLQRVGAASTFVWLPGSTSARGAFPHLLYTTPYLSEPQEVLHPRPEVAERAVQVAHLHTKGVFGIHPKLKLRSCTRASATVSS